jgi:hypothetical protein
MKALIIEVTDVDKEFFQSIGFLKILFLTDSSRDWIWVFINQIGVIIVIVPIVIDSVQFNIPRVIFLDQIWIFEVDDDFNVHLCHIDNFFVVIESMYWCSELVRLMSYHPCNQKYEVTKDKSSCDDRCSSSDFGVVKGAILIELEEDRFSKKI